MHWKAGSVGSTALFLFKNLTFLTSSSLTPSSLTPYVNQHNKNIIICQALK
jgi:hypothetical protein